MVIAIASCGVAHPHLHLRVFGAAIDCAKSGRDAVRADNHLGHNRWGDAASAAIIHGRRDHAVVSAFGRCEAVRSGDRDTAHHHHCHYHHMSASRDRDPFGRGHCVRDRRVRGRSARDRSARVPFVRGLLFPARCVRGPFAPGPFVRAQSVHDPSAHARNDRGRIRPRLLRIDRVRCDRDRYSVGHFGRRVRDRWVVAAGDAAVREGGNTQNRSELKSAQAVGCSAAEAVIARAVVARGAASEEEAASVGRRMNY